MKYLISYDLSGDRDYPTLETAISAVSLGRCNHILGSVWIIDSPFNSKEIYNQLYAHIADMQLIVCEILPDNCEGFIPPILKSQLRVSFTDVINDL